MKNFIRLLKKAFRQPLYAFRIALKRFKARLYYYFGRGLAPSPESLTFFLTHRCNLKCKMCGQWGEGGVTKTATSEFIKSELPIQVFKSFIDDVKHFKPSITLFGGEPFIYKDFIELVKYIKFNNMHCLAITNATLISDVAIELVDSGLDELNVSIDGPGDLHDKIRGLDGLYDKIVSSLQEIARVKRLKGSNKPMVNIQCTITKYNYMEIEKMLNVAESVSADSLTFHNLIFIDSKELDFQKYFDNILSSSSSAWKGFNFSPGIDPDALYRKMEEIKRMRQDFSVDFYPDLSYNGLKNYYKDSSGVPDGYSGRCLSPWIVAYIFPDGEIRPCLNCTYSFGNIRDSKFLKIWNSPKAVKYRNVLKGIKIFPVCKRCTELYRY